MLSESPAPTRESFQKLLQLQAMRKREEAEATDANETPEKAVDPIAPAPILQNEATSEAGEQLATTPPASPSSLAQKLRNDR